MRIGIFGLSGTGKTTAGDYLEANYQVKRFNLDNIGQKLMKKTAILNFVKKSFPETFDSRSGIFSREKLRTILFTDYQKNKVFADYVWPKISLVLKKELAKQKKATHIIIEGALLPIFDISLDKTILFVCPQKEILERIKARNCWSPNETKSLLKIQKEWLNIMSAPDEIIVNDQTLIKLYERLDQLMNSYKIPRKISN